LLVKRGELRDALFKTYVCEFVYVVLVFAWVMLLFFVYRNFSYAAREIVARNLTMVESVVFVEKLLVFHYIIMAVILTSSFVVLMIVFHYILGSLRGIISELISYAEFEKERRRGRRFFVGMLLAVFVMFLIIMLFMH